MNYRFNNIQVEKVFTSVYINSKMQKNFKETLGSIFSDKRYQKYKVIIIIHSFWGSLVLLATYDLYDANVISYINQPQVYYNGQLKIGNEDFNKFLNTKARVIRIVKATDMIPVMQNCHFNDSVGKWYCSNKTISLDSDNLNTIPIEDNMRRFHPEPFRISYGGHILSRRSFMQLNKNLKLKKYMK